MLSHCCIKFIRILMVFIIISILIYNYKLDDLTPDIDINIENLLQKEQDLSTKRNAILLLFISN